MCGNKQEGNNDANTVLRNKFGKIFFRATESTFRNMN